MLALAVDLGTTNLGADLLDPVAGTRLAGRTSPNPQGSFGGDVMSRLLAAQDPDAADTLQRLVVEAIGGLLGRLCAACGASPRDVDRVAVVGNSVMLALLTGQGVTRMLQPEDWRGSLPQSVAEGSGPELVDTWRRCWGLAGSASVEVLGRLGGFVGSDLLAGILATGLAVGPEPALLIDVGTNSELALWDGVRLHVCSAAGGPAFEGVGVSCGMPAVAGAVYRVRDGAGAPGGIWDLNVLGDGVPTGVCGSGLVDLVALLRRGGRLTEGGRLRPAGLTRIAIPGTSFALSHHDLDLLQRAKAAIGAGCHVLCRTAGVDSGSLETLHVGGAFGSYLDVRNATEIGLIPSLPVGAVRFGGNTALAGCAAYLLDPDAAERLAAIRGQGHVTNLADDADFEQVFFEYLFLRPAAAR